MQSVIKMKSHNLHVGRFKVFVFSCIFSHGELRWCDCMVMASLISSNPKKEN